MTQRAKQLQAAADGQITDLIALISTLNNATSRLPCPGREKLGDGTVAACARHTADNYERIAAFVQTGDRISDAHKPPRHAGPSAPRLLRALGHRPPQHAEHDHSTGAHYDQYTADNVDLHALLEEVSATRDALSRVAELTDSQLDAIPPSGSFRFCDGQRTLEQVLANLLKHQRHQVDALSAATA